jgi:hypothetical protein
MCWDPSPDPLDMLMLPGAMAFLGEHGYHRSQYAPAFGPGLLPHERTLWMDAPTVRTEQLGAVEEGGTCG